MSGGVVPFSGDRTPMVEALSHWRLRELLAEVQDRIAQVVDVHDRMDRLIEDSTAQWEKDAESLELLMKEYNEIHES